MVCRRLVCSLVVLQCLTQVLRISMRTYLLPKVLSDISTDNQQYSILPVWFLGHRCQSVLRCVYGRLRVRSDLVEPAPRQALATCKVVDIGPSTREPSLTQPNVLELAVWMSIIISLSPSASLESCLSAIGASIRISGLHCFYWDDEKRRPAVLRTARVSPLPSCTVAVLLCMDSSTANVHELVGISTRRVLGAPGDQHLLTSLVFKDYGTLRGILLAKDRSMDFSANSPVSRRFLSRIFLNLSRRFCSNIRATSVSGSLRMSRRASSVSSMKASLVKLSVVSRIASAEFTLPECVPTRECEYHVQTEALTMKRRMGAGARALRFPTWF